MVTRRIRLPRDFRLVFLASPAYAVSTVRPAVRTIANSIRAPLHEPLVRRVFRLLLLISTLMAALAACMGLALYYAVQHTPTFYATAIARKPETQQEAGDQFEQQVLDLGSQVRRQGQWRAEFTAEQINGWLAADLPEKFPELIPDGVIDPRVAITSNSLQIAYRYQDDNVNTVLSLELETYLTDEPNVVAVRIKGARAGFLPLPQKRLLKEIETAALNADLSLRWAQSHGDPVALVNFPTDEDAGLGIVQLEVVKLDDGKLILSGQTNSDFEPDAIPQTATQPEANQASQI